MARGMIRTNPVNGRTSIYVASHASHIAGLPIEEGRPIIRELIELTTQPDNVYRHVWSAADLVMWDNRCMLHRGRPWDGTKYRRVMHRTTVSDGGCETHPPSPPALRAGSESRPSASAGSTSASAR